MTKINPTPTRHRNTLGHLSVLYVSVMGRAIEREGHDPVPLFTRFNLDDRMLRAPDARISIPRFMRLGQAAIALTGNPALGLVMGELSRPVDAGMTGLAAQSAPTAGQALATLMRFSLLNSRNSRGVPTMADNSRRANFYSIKPYNIFNYFVVDSVLAAWTQFLRIITGQHQVLERVMIEYPSQGLDDEFEQWFGCPVQFGATGNSLYLAAGMESHQSLQAQPAMHDKLVGDCQRALEKIQAGWTLGDQVKDRLTSLLQGETPTLADVAAGLGVAPWTLQRQLAEENTGFRELVDETRRDLAADYIRETRLSLSEIAWLLGFSGPAAFHKAYQRWFATSPGEHRKRFIVEQQQKGIR